jgi:Zn-dependent protease
MISKGGSTGPEAEMEDRAAADVPSRGRSDLLGGWLRHELGHAVSSLALGADRAEVRILPVFGRAFVVNFRDRREAWIALAGPALNLLCAGFVLLLGGRFDLHLRGAPLVDFLFTINLLMGVGNLVPVRPLDGGRALAALARS